MSRVAWAAVVVMSFLLVLLALVGNSLGTALVVTGVAAVILCRVVAGRDRPGPFVSSRAFERRGAFQEVDLEDDYRNAGSSS